MNNIEPINKVSEPQEHTPKPTFDRSAAFTQAMIKQIETFGGQLRKEQADNQKEIQNEKQAVGGSAPSVVQSF